MEAGTKDLPSLGLYNDPYPFTRPNDLHQTTLRSQLQVLTSTAMNSLLFSGDEPNVLLPEPSSGLLVEDLHYQNVSEYNDYSEYNLTDGGAPVHFSVAFQVVIYIIYNTVFVAALLGNILVCYVVFSSPRMRTVTNYLIANLAVGDLLMALLCVPFSYISVLLQYWPFGRVLCHVVAPAQAVFVFVSAYTLVALAGDRYIAILYPLKPRLRRSQAVIVIFIVWIVAIVTAMPIAIFTGIQYNNVTGLPECSEIHWPDGNYRLVYSLTLMILQYFFPLVVLVFTYTRIALAVWGKKAPGEAEDGRDQRLAKAKRKMIKMMLVVVLVYTISWLPFNIIVVYGDLDETIWAWEHMNYAFPIIQWLALSHTVCNPIIYCWMNSRFRAGFRSAIANVPVLKKLTLLGSRSGQDFQLHRMNTCTTYTFVGGKLGRNSSLMSNNGRSGVTGVGSPLAPIIRNFPDGRTGSGPARTSRYNPNNMILNSPVSSSPVVLATNGHPAQSHSSHTGTYIKSTFSRNP